MNNVINKTIIIIIQSFLILLTLYYAIISHEDLLISILATITILAPYTLYFFKKKLNTVLELLYVIFVFLSIYLGSLVGFYEQIFWWDKALHFLSGFILILFCYSIIINIDKKYFEKNNAFLATLILFLFASSLAGIWEIIEYLMDIIFKDLYMQKGQEDTMQDIIFGNLSALLFSIILYIHFKYKKIKIITKTLNLIK